MIVSDCDAAREPGNPLLRPSAPLSRRQALMFPAALLAMAVDSPAATSARVPIAIASSLRMVWPALVDATSVRGLSPTFGASRTLARQLVQGAPFQLLLSADDRSIALVIEAGIAQLHTAIDYASGKLVMLTRADRESPADIDALVRWLLADKGRRIAVAHPDHAPYGQAAVEVLDTIAQRDGLDWRVRPSSLIRGENASQTLQFFLAGAADVALLPASLAGVALQTGLPESAAKLSLVPVASRLHAPLRHRAIALRGAGSQALDLLAALRQTPVQRVLADYGLGPPLT